VKLAGTLFWLRGLRRRGHRGDEFGWRHGVPLQSPTENANHRAARIMVFRLKRRNPRRQYLDLVNEGQHGLRQVLNCQRLLVMFRRSR